MAPLRPLRTFLDASRYYAGGLGRRMIDEPVFIWAQAIGFKVLITILPLILIATGVFGLVLRQRDPFETVADYLRTFLPPGQSGPLIDLMFRLQEASSTLTILGVAFLLVTVLTLFSVLRYIVGTAMGSGRHRYRSFLHGYLFDARMMVQVGLLFLLSFAFTIAASYLNAAGLEVLADLGMSPELLQEGQRLAVRVAALMVPFLFSMAMFAQLFYFIPLPHPPSRSALFGAFFTAVLFEAAKTAFTFYAAWFSQYRTGDEALSAVFWLMIAFVLWVYFSGLVLIIGAIMTNLHELRTAPERSRLRAFVRKYLFRKRKGSKPHPARRSEEPNGEPNDKGGSARPVPRVRGSEAPASPPDR